jgi:DNA modification methylase
MQIVGEIFCKRAYGRAGLVKERKRMNVINQCITDKFALYHGDSCEVLREIPDNSVHYEIYSPPFASLYTYSNSERDLGNCKTQTEFFEQFKFIVKELYRILIPGRLMSVHCTNYPLMKERDGVIGLNDFRGDLIRLFQECGFIYHSEVCIWKDPVIAMQRTKALGLLHKQIKKDSSMSRQGIPDYLVTMRKPGNNPEPITHTNDSFPVAIWQKYVSPIWTDINPSDTLQARSARDEKDERHICPLQLTVIRRGINLWTNPGDTVLSPFGGIGSEGVVAVESGRKAILIEIKDSYYGQLENNMKSASSSIQTSLW